MGEKRLSKRSHGYKNIACLYLGNGARSQMVTYMSFSKIVFSQSVIELETSSKG